MVDNVNAEMGRRRVTQKQMAAWLGISQAAASERLTNKTPFTLDELDVLAERMGVPVGALVLEVSYAVPVAPFQRRLGNEKAGPSMADDPAAVAGAGFEPATSGLWVSHGIAAAEQWANTAVLT